MSADERRGTDGGDHPLDVEARFADIIAHFHDGEPAPPVVVDEDHDAGTARRTEDQDRRDDRGTPHEDEVDRPDGDRSATDRFDGDDDPYDDRYDDHGSTERAATDWAARYEQAAREELAAHEERTARREREARIEAEVDRAVDRASERFVPEEPPPLPRPADLPARLAWGAVLLGPLVLVLVALLWRSAPPWFVGSVVTAIVVGFGYLVWKLPRTHDREGGGDGAIV